MNAYRILVVEDNHEVARMVAASIKTLGTEIDVLDVPSAEEALLISASLPLDLVVLDVRLPGMSGLEMVTRLRKRRPETKIILVTGIEDASVRQQISKAGVEAFFFKPIEITTFLDAVKRSLWSDQSGVNPSTATKILSIDEPALKGTSAVNVGKESPMQGFQPTLDERLIALKQQVSAVSVLLVNDAGQVMEVAGNPSQITSGSTLLPALMQSFSASLRVLQVMGKGFSESLQYFAGLKQCLYLTPVGPKHALLVITSGYFEPDKLGMIDRAIHLAVHDLQSVLVNKSTEVVAKPVKVEQQPTELPTEVIVDQETLAGVEKMFSRARKKSGKNEADGFWETLGENSLLYGSGDKDILSYDQARDMGLAPDEEKQP